MSELRDLVVEWYRIWVVKLVSLPFMGMRVKDAVYIEGKGFYLPLEAAEDVVEYQLESLVEIIRDMQTEDIFPEDVPTELDEADLELSRMLTAFNEGESYKEYYKED